MLVRKPENHEFTRIDTNLCSRNVGCAASLRIYPTYCLPA